MQSLPDTELKFPQVRYQFFFIWLGEVHGFSNSLNLLSYPGSCTISDYCPFNMNFVMTQTLPLYAARIDHTDS